MRQLTIRNVSDHLGKRLEEASARTGKSINSLVVELLDDAFGAGRKSRLRQYVGWTPEEARAFDEALASQRQVDDDAWR